MLNIIWNWMFAGTPASECLIAIENLMCH
jgi:hypothetical protein